MKLSHLLLLPACIVALATCDAAPKMHVDTTSVRTGSDVVLRFDEPLTGPATSQYWVALQRADAPSADTSGRIVLDRTTRVVRFHTSTPGAFEVRIHDGYPRAEHHLLVRIPVTVEGWPVKTGIEPRI